MTKDNENTYGLVLGMCVRFLMNLFCLFLLIQGFTYSYHFSYKLFADLPMVVASPQTRNITIEAGSTAKDISILLEANGIIDDRNIFMARVYLGRYNQKIIAGTYSLGPGMTPDEICRTICGMQREEAS